METKTTGAAASDPTPAPRRKPFRYNGLRLPARNAPCICGSGRKIKFCCMCEVMDPHDRAAYAAASYSAPR